MLRCAILNAQVLCEITGPPVRMPDSPHRRKRTVWLQIYKNPIKPLDTTLDPRNPKTTGTPKVRHEARRGRRPVLHAHELAPHERALRRLPDSPLQAHALRVVAPVRELARRRVPVQRLQMARVRQLRRQRLQGRYLRKTVFEPSSSLHLVQGNGMTSRR